jgi:hypothetical protein
MYDLWYQLRSTIKRIVGVWAWDFGAGDGIVGAVDDEKGQKRPDAVDQVGDDGDIENDKEEDAAPHDLRL